ncbi:MAG: putative collagen-binding domain-containing protein [Nitrospirota bacterium]
MIEAGTRGIYVAIVLFNGWSVDHPKGSFALDNPWNGHPYNPANNVNGINGDPNGDQSGSEIHSLSIPAITALQEEYVKKVVDTVNDLDNVLYEISNESHENSQDWQYAMINHLKSYEATNKPKQHPVGMTAEWPNGADSDLFNSPADWISPNNSTNDYLDNPPAAIANKVILSDTDHLCGVCGDRAWVWKSFTRGINPIFMDVYDGAAIGFGANGFTPNDPVFVDIRKQMGYALTYANRTNLAAMSPQPSLCETGHCLARNGTSGAEFLVYQPGSGAFTVDLTAVAGSLIVEWFDPRLGQAQSGSPVAGGLVRLFTPPFDGDAVLYLHQ